MVHIDGPFKQCLGTLLARRGRVGVWEGKSQRVSLEFSSDSPLRAGWESVWLRLILVQHWEGGRGEGCIRLNINAVYLLLSFKHKTWDHTYASEMGGGMAVLKLCLLINGEYIVLYKQCVFIQPLICEIPLQRASCAGDSVSLYRFPPKYRWVYRDSPRNTDEMFAICKQGW